MSKAGKKELRSTHALLAEKGYETDQPLSVRKKISTSEKGKKYILITNGKEESVVYAIDGYIIKTGKKCDKLILVRHADEGSTSEAWTEVFVELKGVDTASAIKQLRETLSSDLFKHPSNVDIRARIVAQSFPSNKSNPMMEKAKTEFKANFNCELRGFKTGQEDKL